MCQFHHAVTETEYARAFKGLHIIMARDGLDSKGLGKFFKSSVGWVSELFCTKPGK